MVSSRRTRERSTKIESNQMMSTTSEEHQRTFLGSKIERLTHAIRRIPPMSKKSLERWSEARDTYLGQVQPRLPQPKRRRADEPPSSSSIELTDQSIQADLSRSLSELTSLADSDDSELVSTDLQRVECSDKATATEEDPVVRERRTSPSIHSRHMDTPNMLPTASISPTISVREQFQRWYSLDACCFGPRENVGFVEFGIVSNDYLDNAVFSAVSCSSMVSSFVPYF